MRDRTAREVLTSQQALMVINDLRGQEVSVAVHRKSGFDPDWHDAPVVLASGPLHLRDDFRSVKLWADPRNNQGGRYRVGDTQLDITETHGAKMFVASEGFGSLEFDLGAVAVVVRWGPLSLD